MEKLVLRTIAPFYILQIITEALFGSRDKNFITKNKKKMTGNVSVSTSPKYKLKEIKDLSKKLGITINDLIMCALSTSVKQYLKIKGDPLGEPGSNSQIQIAMPANIRWGFYPTRADTKTENKFSSVPLTIPLCENMKDSYSKIQKITKVLKGKFAYIYASYALTFWASIFSPRALPRLIVHKASMNFTCAFSNTPGPLKPFLYTNL